ncbi:MAG: hypothetical protein ABI867_18305 [Kofleriaceae bacterium]
MGKPTVSVTVPGVFVVGQVHPIEVWITTDVETKVEGITGTLVGTQGWSLKRGKGYVGRSRTFLSFETALAGAGTLAVGSTRYATTLMLPADSPPSHRHEPAWVSYELKIQIALPWQVDVRHRIPLRASVAAVAKVSRTPITLRSQAASAAIDAPRIELSLASTGLVVGESVTGSVAVFHLSDGKPRTVALQVRPRLRLKGAEGGIYDSTGTQIELVIPVGGAGSMLPFLFHLQDSMTPAFDAVTHGLDWYFFASTGSSVAGKISAGVELQISGSSIGAARLTLAPPVGDARIAAMFERFAASGWRRVTDDHAAVELVIEREVDDIRLRLLYDYRNEEGIFVSSKLAYDSLGLGLEVTPSSFLRAVISSDIEVEHADWDRAHHVHARSAAQTLPLLRAIVPALLRVAALGTLTRWDDHGLTFERVFAAAVEEPALAEMTSTLGGLAHAIATARPLVGPPPELAIAIDLAGWRQLAEWLDGTFCVGDISIHGTLQGSPVRVALEWESGPTRVRASVGQPDSVSPPTAERLGELVSTWPSELELRVSDGVASAVANTLETPRVRELVEALRGVLSALEPSAGPYR